MRQSFGKRGEEVQEMAALHASGAAVGGIDPEHEVRRDLGELDDFTVACGPAGGTDRQGGVCTSNTRRFRLLMAGQGSRPR